MTIFDHYNLLVIGNGFDIAHGLKTSFKDFAKNAQEQMNTGRYFSEEYHSLIEKSGLTQYFTERLELECWVDVEKEIKKILECVDSFIDNYEDHTSSDSYYLGDLDIYTKTVLVSMGIAEEISTLTRISEEYYDLTYGIKEDKIIECMEIQLNGFIDCFEYYLKNIMPSISEQHNFIQKIIDLDPQYVLSFNYTDTYKEYGVDKSRVTHIHGEVGENNIVLGIDNDDTISQRFIAFKKLFQVIQKENQRIDFGKIRKQLDFEGQWTFYAYFFGHSFDITDAELIHSIRKGTEKMKIFYYCEEDRNQKLKNIFEVFGQKDALIYLQRGTIELLPLD